MEQTFYYDIAKIALAFALGALLGVEREYKKKPAGFRTLIMITVGATLFTILSNHIEGNPDRIAANIITGIGFIGAGVIFKEGIKVNGMTTAATIWIAASIGMAIGYGAFYLAIVVALLTLFTLVLLEKLELFFQQFHQAELYKITFSPEVYTINELEGKFKELTIEFIKTDVAKDKNEVVVLYQLSARRNEFKMLNDFLLNNQAIISFES